MTVIKKLRELVRRISRSPKRLVLAASAAVPLTLLAAMPAYAQAADGGKPETAAWLALVLIIMFIPEVLAFGAFALIWRGLFPRKVEWTGEIARRMPWGSFFFGLVAVIFLLVIAAWLGSAGDAGGLVAVILIAAFVMMFVTFGKVAMIEWAGEMIDPAASGIRRALFGSGGLYLLLFIPIGGWLVLMGIGFMAVGAAIMSYIPPKSPVASGPAQEQKSVETHPE